jgi:molybdate transport system ATP-binding protein
VTLGLEIRHAFERLTIDVRLSLGGGLTALLGPSGAGKTTLLNAVAGLLRPDHGHVALDGQPLTDTARGIFVPPHDRGIGYVFQDSRLFPHLTVRQNLGYGRWFAKNGGGVASDEVIDLLGLKPLLHRHPGRLSGGEKRRVAIGRALLSHPRLLLLDEPLGPLDTARRQEILPYLDRMIRDLRVPMVYVTHDEREIHGRAEQIVVLDHGRVAEPGEAPAR